MRPDDLERSEQMAFLHAVLGPPPARILDVGCGDGALATRLLAQGFQVVAIDADPEAVGQAHEAGVPALHEDFTHYEDDPFDAVLFSRSLHHIHPLEPAVARAHHLLRPGGRLVADEFAVDRTDRETAEWFYDTMSLLEAAGILSPSERVPHVNDPFERWCRHHEEDPPMHGGDEMIRAVKHRFLLQRADRVPYLWGYLGGWLEETDRGGLTAWTLQQIERRRVADRSLAPTGLQLVAKPRY
jgi:SAM-dependent methyltransferase